MSAGVTYLDAPANGPRSQRRSPNLIGTIKFVRSGLKNHNLGGFCHQRVGWQKHGRQLKEMGSATYGDQSERDGYRAGRGKWLPWSRPMEVLVLLWEWLVGWMAG